MERDDVALLFKHMEWADSLIWKAVLATQAADSDTVLKERLHHVHLVQRIYLQIWQDDPHEVREVSEFASVDEVYDWVRDYYRDLRLFVDSLDPSSMERTIAFPWAEELVKWFGQARTATLQETILQVTTHTAHHRGQLSTMIRQLGGTPPLTDFIAWVWTGKPEPVWASAEVP